MSANLAGFDASTIPEQQEFTALPEGDYVAIATHSEMKPTKSGTGQYLQFTYEVLDGAHKGRKIFDRMNLVNPNQTAVEIAQRALASLCKAVGVMKPNDSAELHNKPFMVSLAVEVDDRKREGNVVKKYSQIGGMQPQHPAAAAASPAAAPWSAPAAAGAAPPWAK